MAEDVQSNVESLNTLTGRATFRRYFHQETVVVIANCSRVFMERNKTKNAYFQARCFLLTVDGMNPAVLAEEIVNVH
jgi:hypothetical protein